MVDKATVTGKGQITIPKSIRKKMGLEKGQKVVFELKDEETVIYPEISDPYRELRDLREKYQFSRDELNAMKDKAERSWDRLSS
jgi:AbrB family looped-hinge helix DNA binding protein